MFLASLCSIGDWFESLFGGNPIDRFCHDEAQLLLCYLRSMVNT